MRDAYKPMGLYVFQVQGGAKPTRSRVLAEKQFIEWPTDCSFKCYIYTYLSGALPGVNVWILLRDPGRFSHRVLPVETFNTDRKYGGT